MDNNLTESVNDRQNILNNRYALQQAERHLELGGILFDGDLVFTKQQVMDIFEIGDATIERYLSSHDTELKNNGYRVLRGARLREFKNLAYGTLTNEGTRTSVLGVFSFRAVLNLGMLLTESEPAKLLRSRLLDIVLDVMVEKSGGHTKYINQRDEHFLSASFQEDNYRQLFTDALDNYVEGNKWKYGNFTNLIYKCIFQENAKEYRAILKLAEKDSIRDTMYAEVLTLIASFESGIAHEFEVASKAKGEKLTQKEARNIISNFEKHPLYKPYIVDARIKMASRDLCFRDALHEKLEAYIEAVPEADFEKFLGEKSRSLEEQLSDPETLAVFKRLKDK
ncbi:DNA-binding protein [uncultured Psychrobacter sp.]|uniref:DNA-binding protein n=1 Tax=uncultured Psychrobacter sp. TaxID=259303 RepID=UPI00263890BE|nr:DNA-binding protein [uncultured Psychrobacter sp.]